jgi:hypothetical protein
MGRHHGFASQGRDTVEASGGIATEVTSGKEGVSRLGEEYGKRQLIAVGEALVENDT